MHHVSKRLISSPETEAPKDQTAQELANGVIAGVPVLVPSADSLGSAVPKDPDLVRIQGALEHLPDTIKAAILALVDAAEKTAGGARG